MDAVSVDANERLAPIGGAAGTAASVVVYTAITAGYDDLKDPPPGACAGARYVAFLEDPLAPEAWCRQPLHAGLEDPVRNAKIHKVLSHRFFPDAEYSLWIDGSVALRFAHGVDRLIDTLLADRDLVVFRHRQRTCVYQEAVVCLQRQLDDPDTIWQQVCRYSAEGYPANAGDRGGVEHHVGVDLHEERGPHAARAGVEGAVEGHHAAEPPPARRAPIRAAGHRR